jgi:hypothetical protein
LNCGNRSSVPRVTVGIVFLGGLMHQANEPNSRSSNITIAQNTIFLLLLAIFLSIFSAKINYFPKNNPSKKNQYDRKIMQMQ